MAGGGQECRCYSTLCSDALVNGLENGDWESYHFDCTTSEVDSTIFSGSVNLISTAQSSARALRMLHPTNLVRTNKEVIKDTFTDTIKASLNDRATARTETFYIAAIADGGSRMVDGPYTITIKCDYTIEIREPTSFQREYTFVLGATSTTEDIVFSSFSAWDSDEPARNVEARCPIITYEPEPDTGMTRKPGCSQPCNTLNVVNSEPAIFTSAIIVRAEGDALFTSQKITAEIVCGPLSVTITLPTINSPYRYPIKLSDSDRPRVELPNPTSNQPKCGVTSVTLTHDGTNPVQP